MSRCSYAISNDKYNVIKISKLGHNGGQTRNHCLRCRNLIIIAIDYRKYPLIYANFRYVCLLQRFVVNV
jgi:hypothetical protein